MLNAISMRPIQREKEKAELQEWKVDNFRETKTKRARDYPRDEVQGGLAE
jgi:hypothetical protein